MATNAEDTLSAGNAAFAQEIAVVLKYYKERRPDRGSVQFAGITAILNDDGIRCGSGDYISGIRRVDVAIHVTDKLPSPKALHSLAAKLLWVGRCGRPGVFTNKVGAPEPKGQDAVSCNGVLMQVDQSKENFEDLALCTYTVDDAQTVAAVKDVLRLAFAQPSIARPTCWTGWPTPLATYTSAKFIHASMGASHTHMAGPHLPPTTSLVNKGIDKKMSQ